MSCAKGLERKHERHPSQHLVLVRPPVTDDRLLDLGLALTELRAKFFESGAPMQLMTYWPDFADPVNYPDLFMNSRNARENGQNQSYYRNPKVDELRRAFTGEILTPDDCGYDDARRVWNAVFDRRPAVVVRPLTVGDVVAAVRTEVGVPGVPRAARTSRRSFRS